MIFACSGDNTNFAIKVKVDGTDGSQLYLAQRTLTGTIVVDSALPDKSRTYLLEGSTKLPDFYIVYAHPGHYINLIIRPGDKFKVLATASTFEYSYQIEGSMDSRLIQKMVVMQSKTLEKITELSTEFENNRGRADFQITGQRIDSIYAEIVDEHRLFSKNLIEENPGSLASLMALYQQLGSKTPVFNYNQDFRYFEMVDSSLSALYPGSEAVRDLDRKVTELRNLLRLEKGAAAPEIELPDAGGNIIRLSSLKGKYVLLAFWASWSSQSRDEIKKLAGMYKKYSSMGIEYLLVSLDRTRESWVQCLKTDNVGGIQVCDFKYWDSPVVGDYQVEQLPVLYLLDKDGRVVNRNFTADELDGIISAIPGLAK
jgi:hypothetical protein